MTLLSFLVIYETVVSLQIHYRNDFNVKIVNSESRLAADVTCLQACTAVCKHRGLTCSVITSARIFNLEL